MERKIGSASVAVVNPAPEPEIVAYKGGIVSATSRAKGEGPWARPRWENDHEYPRAYRSRLVVCKPDTPCFVKYRFDVSTACETDLWSVANIMPKGSKLKCVPVKNSKEARR